MTGSFRPTKTMIALCCAGLSLTTARAETLRDLAYVQIVSNVPFERQIEAARTLGVRKVRLAVRWNEVETARGQWDWQASDTRLRAVEAAGLVPMITLFGSNKAYPHREGVTRGAPSTDDAIAGFAHFAAATAKRYGTGTSAAPIYYEIWNEPNTRTFWGRAPEPEAYAKMAAQACEAIRKAKPAAKILVLAMEGTPVKTPYVVKEYGLDIYQQWAARAATPELMGCADGISMHPYLPLPEYYQADEPALQRFFAKHWGKPAPPIVANSEWGYKIDAGRGHTAERQAAMDLRALLLGAGKRRPTNLYQIVDGGRDGSQPDQSFGLFDYAGKQKLSGIAVKRLLDAIGDYTIDGVAPLPDTENAWRFTASRGAARAEVLWTSKDSASVKVAPRGTAIDLVSGAPRPIENGAIAITSNPVLLRWTR